MGKETESTIKKNSNITFLVPYPAEEAPSQRFRFEQYIGILEKEGFSVEMLSFYSLALWHKMYKSGSIIHKLFGVFISFFKRWLHLFKVLKSDFVFIHRELAPLGPPFFEWVIAKVLRKKIIYDFDDAIWLTDEKARFSNVVRCFWKVKYICKWSYKVSCGNEYLAVYARQWNKNVVINPTTIDMNYHRPEDDSKAVSKELVLGWTGSHSTLKYLSKVFTVLKELEDKIRLVVICNMDPEYDLKNYEFIPWSKGTEVTSLNQIDVGIMPLPDDEWAKGKCGFKALQYMAMKKPVIASPVGVNTVIIKDKETGYLASSLEEWKRAIEEIILSHNEEGLGEKGFNVVKGKYSVESNQRNFLSFFE